jgi:4-hydroxybutyrate CoA-transferase
MCSGLVFKPLDIFKGEFKGHINYYCIFQGPVERHFQKEGNIDTCGYAISTTAWALENVNKPSVCILELAPPDENGDMSFGTFSGFGTWDAVQYTKKVGGKILVQVNKKQPRVYGVNHHLNVKDVDMICEVDTPMPVVPELPATDVEKKMGQMIADMIEDGSNIQIGIGGVANVVGHLLDGKKNLGIHTELWTDSMTALVKKGVITNAKKSLHPGKSICSFTVGSQETYDFLENNPQVEFHPVTYTNHITTLAKVDKLVAINNAIAVDLTGQVCAESIGHVQYSGTGGQLDFVLGSAISKGGMSFTVLPSVVETKHGRVTTGIASTITTEMMPGSIVSVPRSYTHYVVTEYGIADMKSQSASKRVERMIAIAHPDFRDQLRREAKAKGIMW